MADELTAALQRLIDGTGASRCTLRQDLDGSFTFPVTHEVCVAGAPSLRDDASVDARSAPTIKRLLRERAPVVIEDCRRAAVEDPDYRDEGFLAMLDNYGGLSAFVVFPLFDGDRMLATIALHQLGAPRRWTQADLALGAQTAEAVWRAIAPTRPT